MPMTRATLHYLDNPDPKKLASFRTCASAMSVMAKRTSHLEAERKFTPTALLKSQLDGNYKEYVQSLRRLDGAAKSTHRPCTLSFFRLPDKGIIDTYVDYQGRLSKQGVWIRHRTTKVLQTESFPILDQDKHHEKATWEAKLRISGDYTDSQMLEETGRQRVKEIAYHYLGDKSEELATSAELETYRKTYIVTKPFEYQRFDKSQYEIRIVIDEVSAPAEAHKADKFYHQVGEVELTKDVVGGETDDEHKAIREEEVKSMKAHMDEFLFWNSGVFPTEPAPKGKLQAFREWKEGKGGPVVESMSSV